MQGSWFSAPPRRLRRGAVLTLAFASLLTAGAAAGSFGGELSSLGSLSPDPRNASSARAALSGPQGTEADGKGAGGRDSERPGGAGASQDDAAGELVSRSGDRWSAAYSAREYEGLRQALDGTYVGVGISVRQVRPGDGRARGGRGPAVEVDRVHPDSPAARAGVRAGDRLRTVDGTAVKGMPVTDVVAMLRGSEPGSSGGSGPGTRVSLALASDGDRAGAGGELREWHTTLRRAQLHTEAVAVDRLDDGVTRIKVSSFTRGSGARVREAVEREVPPGAGILLDLRGNAGGLVGEAVTAASAFLDGGLVATYDDDGTQRALYAHHGGASGGAEHGAGSGAGDGAQAAGAGGGAGSDGSAGSPRSGGAAGSAGTAGNTSGPVVVLVDGGTMSAAELLTGALQDRGRAVVVGSRTFGKGSVQMPRPQRDGSVAELTVGHYTTPSGREVEGEGLAPDLPVDSRKESTERARTVLSGLEARS